MHHEEGALGVYPAASLSAIVDRVLVPRGPTILNRLMRLRVNCARMREGSAGHCRRDYSGSSLRSAQGVESIPIIALKQPSHETSSACKTGKVTGGSIARRIAEVAITELQTDSPEPPYAKSITGSRRPASPTHSCDVHPTRCSLPFLYSPLYANWAPKPMAKYPRGTSHLTNTSRYEFLCAGTCVEHCEQIGRRI